MRRSILLAACAALLACRDAGRAPANGGEGLGAGPRDVAVPAAAPSDAPAVLPAKGQPYSLARAALLQAGWTAANGRCEGGGTSGAICRDFPEIENCSGTGLGFCDMRFEKAGACLVLVTVGGPPGQPGGDTVVEEARTMPRDCRDSARAEDKDMAEAGELAGLPAATDGLCARLERQGVSRAVLIDEFVPYFPPSLKDPARVEGVAMTEAQLDDAVRQLACGAGLSGFGPDIPETALALFASRRHGRAAEAALARLAREGSPTMRAAADGLRKQMATYLTAARQGNG